MKVERFMGIDGCRSGWFCAWFEPAGAWGVDIVDDQGLGDGLMSTTSAFIDIPIGLPGRGESGRACDREARQALGRPRASSVFPVPVRAVLSARDYRQALGINRSQAGRGISKQSWFITAKIKAVDRALQNTPALRPVLHESHPELCFWAFNGEVAMQHNKKTIAGRTERFDLLQRIFPLSAEMFDAARKRFKRSEVALDDILDALVLLASAQFGARYYQSLPACAPTDSTGLKMQIVFAKPIAGT